MKLPQNCIVIASFLLLVLHSCQSSRYSHLNDVKDILEKFINQKEELFWSRIQEAANPQDMNMTLTTILDDLDAELRILSVGKVDAVRLINEELAAHIDEIKRLQHSETRWLEERRYDDYQRHCSIITSTIPNEIYKIFEITKNPSFLAYLRDNSDFCHTNKRIVSPGVEDLQLHNVVMDFYSTVVETLAKGYITSQMAFLVQRAKGAGNSYHESSLDLRHKFMPLWSALDSSVQPILQNFTGEIWNCDDFHSEFSYTEIVNFIQGYVDNEINFNREDTCSKQCSDFKHVDYHICRNSTLCILNYLDKNKTRCDGEIRSCEFIESDMKLCPNENDQSPNRRYHYIEYSSGLMLGRPRFCPYELKVKSWTRWFYHCSYCFCYCDHASSKYTDRYFSLRDALSNVQANKVVTGIRFLKKNRIIHIFIKERKLGRDGTIESENDDTEEIWIGDYNFVKEDSGVKEGVDYHELTWKNHAIDLDTLRAPKDEVVTGARFRVVDDRLRFEIRTTPFDRATGDVARYASRSSWRTNNVHDKQRLPILEVDIPTRAPLPSKRIRTDNMYIEFTPTDMYKDIAQTTVPFIDTQPVESTVLKPLAGAGIYYKTTPGYGGFIGPLIILHDD